MTLMARADSPIASTGRKPRPHRRQRRRFDGLLFVLPALLLLGVFHVGASVFSAVMSGTTWSLAGASFIGLDNYVQLFASPEFANSLKVTTFFLVGTVPTTLMLALPLAYTLHYRLAPFLVYRIIIFTPYVVPTVAIGMVFGTIFGPTPAGMANAVLSWFGVASRQWLLDDTGVVNLVLAPAGIEVEGFWAGPSVALSVTMLAQVWHLLGFAVVVLLSALTSIDPALPEAAKVDGAGHFRILRSIITPLLVPTILFLSIVLTIFSVREFNLIYILTEGGPFGSSETLTMLMVRQFYEENALGLGATTAVVLALAVAVFSVFQFRISRSGADLG